MTTKLEQPLRARQPAPFISAMMPPLLRRLLELSRWIAGGRVFAHALVGRRRSACGVATLLLVAWNDQSAMAPSRGTGDPAEVFRRAGSVLAVCAHPDDESCGLGAVLALAVSLGKHVSLLTCTRGEAGITPTWRGTREELAARREGELGLAAEILGIHRRVVLGYPDGLLAKTDPWALDRECQQLVRRWRPDVVLAYDPKGVTCHPDHVAVGEAVLRAWSRATNPPGLLFWTIPDAVAARMRMSLGGAYVGRPPSEVVPVDVSAFRERQHWAVQAHASQSCDLSPQFSLRVQLCGPYDYLTSPHLWSGNAHGDPSWSPGRLTTPNSEKGAT